MRNTGKLFVFGVVLLSVLSTSDALGQNGLEGLDTLRIDVRAKDYQEKEVAEVVRGYLEENGIPVSNSTKYLVVRIRSFGRGASVEISLSRMVSYESKGREYSTIGSTWSYHGYVSGPIDMDDVMIVLKKYLGYFVGEYKKANES